MRSRRVTYLPITSIVIGIVILAVAVTAVSYRDIRRGREQVSEILWYQARGFLTFTGAALRAELLSPTWRLDRIHTLFTEAAESSDVVAYIAVLDHDGRVVLHSNSDEVGDVLPDVRFEEIPFERLERLRGPLFSGRQIPPRDSGPVSIGRRVVDRDGRRVHEYRLSSNVHPVPSRAPRVTGRHGGDPARPARIADPAVVTARLSELLGRTIDAGSAVQLTVVVGLDATDVEAAFRASREYTLLLSGILLLVGGAAIYFLFATAHHRSTRTALENMRSYTRNIIESMASGMVSLDADGLVATLNSRGRAVLGVGDEIVEGRPLEGVLRVESEGDRTALDSVMDGSREMLEIETRVTGNAGSIPVALSASSLRDEEGDRSGTVLLFQDLREMEELKDAIERERHLASLGRLAAGVAHEVRNPLSSLKGFAQFFRSKFKPGSEEERYSDIMIEEVERLDRVVQELLDFARPVAPDRRPTDPNVLVEEALSLVSEDAQFNRVEIVRELAGDLPSVMVDPLQIRQALLNVLLNAMEAMTSGGTLTIETEDAGDDGGGAYVRIGLSDTGVGMSADELSKLFEPFFTTKPKGTGLGLTVVSRVIEQNGGRVGVESVEGRGTTFSLLLPVSADSASGVQ